jgi:hypothetical protein
MHTYPPLEAYTEAARALPSLDDAAAWRHVPADLAAPLRAYLEAVHRAQVAHGFAQGFPPFIAVAALTIEAGRDFVRVVETRREASGDPAGQRMVHSFVAVTDGATKALGTRKPGDVFKAATWKAPARHVRGSILGDPAEALTDRGSIRYL